MPKIFVLVLGGVAEVDHETVPEGIEVEIVDFDNIKAGDPYPSQEAEERYNSVDILERNELPRGE